MRFPLKRRGFRSPNDDGRYCYTVDSFQGSEADVTIVSLVRNNDHSNIKSALGFLGDFRRMNVLLSRAKWRLISRGSLRLPRRSAARHRIAGTSEPIEFLGSLFDSFGAAEPKRSSAANRQAGGQLVNSVRVAVPLFRGKRRFHLKRVGEERCGAHCPC